MARRLMTKARRDALLPLATEGGALVGIIPDEWQPSFRECCADPRHWQGYGDVRPLSRPKPGLPADPWWYKGYRRYRAARCVLCLQPVNAHEYLVAEEG